MVTRDASSPSKQQTSYVGLVAVVSGEQSRQLAGATESDVVFTDAPRIAAHCCCYYLLLGREPVYLSFFLLNEKKKKCPTNVDLVLG